MPNATITNVRRGDVHRWSRTLIPTAREAPSDAETASHVLLHRAGYIRPVSAGIYDYLPLAWRTLRKISDIIRDELDRAGASEMLMPAMEPIELFAGSKRDIDYGDNLFKLTDRRGRVAALAPTHEEVITELLRTAVTSYKQLPLILYQIQTKFRDEARPRAGLLRCREFLMKDAYSFHTSVDGPGGLGEAYDALFTAYSNVFTRCGLDFSAVEAESGPIGGSASHEFMVNCDSGEDTVLRCPVSGYAANVEKCEIGPRPGATFEGPAGEPLTPVHTPGLPGIDGVARFLGTTPSRMLKSIVFSVTHDKGNRGLKWVVATVRGDHDVNEGKVKTASDCSVTLADERAARAAGFAIGYVSPRTINTVPNTLLLVDEDAARPHAWVTGDDRPDFHARGFHWSRDIGPRAGDQTYVKLSDLRNALAGDPSPKAPGSVLEVGRGIEVGHVFKLGTKYSDAMGFGVLDDRQQKRAVIMGCYGIGVSRTMAACVESSRDDNGIIWPSAIAPYHVLIVLMKPDDARQRDAADRLSSALSQAGVDVLIDDRDERPGVKFKDADLIGIPARVTLGDRALDQGAAEFKMRRDPGKGDNVPLEAVPGRVLQALGS